jgi:hypothetical protein
MTLLTDAEVVETFVAYLAEHRFPGIRVDGRPDVDNRNSEDIDAIAGPLAIEHTSVDTVENQRRNSAWFGRVAEPLEARFAGRLPFRLRLIFPYDGIAIGQDWNGIGAALETWVSTTVPGLGDGRGIATISGVPFQLHYTKESDRPPGLFCMRIAPDDATLAQRVAAQIRGKAKKLVPYRRDGMTTVLLVDSGDIALMNVHKLKDAVLAAFPEGLPAGIDELWHADTSVPAAVEFWDIRTMLTETGPAV